MKWDVSSAGHVSSGQTSIETILFNSKSNINIKTNLCRVDNWENIYQKIKVMKKNMK